MLKKLLLFALLLTILDSKTQTLIYQGSVYMGSSAMNYLPFKHEYGENIKSIRYKCTDFKGAVTNYIKNFDKNGNPISYYKVLDNGELIPVHLTTYNELGKILTDSHFNKKGQLSYKVTNSWNQNGDLTSSTQTNGKDKISTHFELDYMLETSCLQESRSYKKDSEIPRQIWKHTYYDACKKSKSVCYGKNGKIKKEIDYTCKEDGETIEPGKNTTQVCTWDESSADFLLKIFQEVGSKGRLTKTIQKLNRADSSLVEIIKYDEDDKLTYRETFLGDYKFPLHSYSYHKGKINYERIQTYDNKKMTSSSHVHKGTLFGKTEYNYDNTDKVANYRYIGKGNKLRLSIVVEYENF